MAKHGKTKTSQEDRWLFDGKNPIFKSLSKVIEVQQRRHVGHANLFELVERVLLFFLTDGGDESVCLLNSWENKSLLLYT